MQFGGAQPPESLHEAESTWKRVNHVLYFLRLPVQLTVLGDSTLPFSWSGANVFLGARGLFLSLVSGKDSQQKLSCCVIKTGPLLDSFTAQSKIFFCLGGAQAAPTMRHGTREWPVSCVFTSC